ncbi:MAG: hypothetical protein P1U56_10215 [Saprospiraceae bacterium]|nr:hypothetical protein [Saprospiraceae bacterium]
MKKLLLGLFIATTLFASCGSDCELTELDEIILGEWTLNGSDITFNADGTMDDPDNVFEAEINGVSLQDKTYTLDGNSTINIKSSSEDPPASLSFSYEVTEYDCDEIKMTAFILTLTLKRK